MATKKTLVLGVATLLLVAGGSGTAYYFVTGSKKEAIASSQEPPQAPKAPIYIQIEPLNVPVVRDDNRRYVYSVAINLQVNDEKSRDLVNSLMPRLRDAFLRQVNANPVPAQKGSDSVDLERLKIRLSEIADKVVGPKVVEDVLFIRIVRLMI